MSLCVLGYPVVSCRNKTDPELNHRNSALELAIYMQNLRSSVCFIISDKALNFQRLFIISRRHRALRIVKKILHNAIKLILKLSY